jgi:hypothetical protein
VPDLSQPFAIAAAVAIAGFTAVLVKDVIADLRKRLDASDARLDKLAESQDKLADALKDGLRDLRP